MTNLADKANNKTQKLKRKIKKLKEEPLSYYLKLSTEEETRLFFLESIQKN